MISVIPLFNISQFLFASMNYRAVLLLAFLSLCSAQAPTTSPAFLWANKNFFQGQNTQVTNVVSMRDIEHIITGKPSALSQYVSSSSPEVIFVFVEPELTTITFMDAAGSRTAQVNGGSFVNLKALVETSPSSIVIPYVGADASLIPSLQTQTLATIMSATQLKTSLANKNWDILNNGITDIIVVQFENSDYVTHDTLLAQVDKAMKATSYVGVLASAAAPVLTFEEIFPVHFALRAANNNTNTTTNSTSDMWPDGIVSGLIIMIPFLFILFLGICCTFSVQSGLKFEVEKVKKQ